MNLLFITNVFPNPYQPTKGTFNLALVQALADAHEVQVISPISWIDEWRAKRAGATPLAADRKATLEGIEVHYPRYVYPPELYGGSMGGFMRRAIRSTVERLPKRPDAVLAYWAHPDGEAAVHVARSLGLPAVVMVGGSDVLLLARRGARRRCIADVLKSAHAVITTSHDLANHVVAMQVPRDRIHVAYRGVDTGLFTPGDRKQARQSLGLPQDLPILLWVGRMVSVKGLDVLLHACSILHSRPLKFRLCLAGDGELRRSLEKTCAARELTDKVAFVGSIPQQKLPDWYRAADLTVLPSHSEGIPNVLRESMACGTPFVATSVGGIPEIAQDGLDRLVPAGNPAALADAIAQSLEMGTRTPPRRTRPATWTDSANVILRVLESLLPPRTLAAAPKECARAACV